MKLVEKKLYCFRNAVHSRKQQPVADFITLLRRREHVPRFGLVVSGMCTYILYITYYIVIVYRERFISRGTKYFFFFI